MVCNPMSNAFLGLKYVCFAGDITSRCTQFSAICTGLFSTSLSADSATNCNRNEDTNTRCGAFDQLKTKSNARYERSLYNIIMQRRECPPKQRNRSRSTRIQSKMGRKTNKPEAKTRPQHISAGTSSLTVDRKL